ncbi:CYFA0S12e00122g1_1 [Cyberlindnera fabianii]|uniref:CYFA0S12e00122g1_1 n=1 Tax=Cyberlindnera fabianii TaxID=36022 RepID=A0A061B0R2_CYBFA|nr:CYFA0S12e00122g1_1 [Cyberlindnera fabianii]
MSIPVDPELARQNDADAAIYDDIDVDAMMAGTYNQQEDDDNNPIAFSDFEDDDGSMDRSQIDDDVLAAFSEDEEDWYEDDDEQDFMDAIREANNFSTKKRSNRKRFTNIRPDKELDPEIRILLSNGNDMFVSKDLEGAEKMYLEVVKRDPKNFPAYKSLGEIYQIQNAKNKSCNAWFLAAHIKPQDGEFWAQVAKQSRELGHNAQALYCYGRAITAGYKVFDVLLERAILYRETGQLGRASENLQKLHEAYPHKAGVLRELALIYIQLNRVNDAIAMYLKVFEKNVLRREREEASDDDYDMEEGTTRSSKVDFPVFDWSSLNILTELFMNQKNYTIAIKTIKHIARWIQRREDEDFWEEAADDSEFDERRYENSKFEALPDILKTRPHKLPVDIRVKLGSLRLNLQDVDEALVHYKFLLNDDVSDMADLFFEAASKLEESQLFGDAIKFYLPLSKLDEFHTSQLFTSLARCSTELGKYEEAKDYYNTALSMDPQNLDIMLSLVEVLYYLDEVEESQKLLDKVNVLRFKKSDKANQVDTSVPEAPVEDQALIQNTAIRVAKKGSKMSDFEKQAREDRIKQNVIEKHKRLQRLRPGLEAGDKVAASTWIQLASDLIEIFSNVRNFFPRDRSRQFKGIIMRTKGLQMDIDSKIERISQLYEGFTSKVEEKVVLTSKEEFRGVKYEDWFDLFMEYALAVARFDNPYDANSIIDNAKNVNVFFQNKEREKVMSLIKLAISLRTRDQKEILLSLRAVLNTCQFNRKLLKLFLLVQPSGKLCTENFISINHQKYFLRQIKAFDSLKLKKTIPGMATIVDKDLDPQGADNIYLMYIYACLLFTNRSYVPSLVYFTRIYKSYKTEPLVCFLSGLAHVHRAMQRSSTNRHMELLQGFKYLMEYFELRSPVEKQETLYNLGRVFHLLGLVSIAVEYYNRVLEEFEDQDDEEDLKRQTAYNLVLIYNSSGNTRLSNMIMERYLTV